jgi:hypothetical protein
MIIEINPAPSRGRQIDQTPANHNGLSRCPAGIVGERQQTFGEAVEGVLL